MTIQGHIAGSDVTLKRPLQGQVLRVSRFVRAREAAKPDNPTLATLQGQEGRVKSFLSIRAHTHAAANSKTRHYPTLSPMAVQR